MIWPAMVFNLCVALLFAGFLLRAVRRFERRADAIMAKMDEADAESDRKFDTARDEIRASMRARVDRMIAKLVAESPPATDAESLRYIDTVRPTQVEVVPSRSEIELLPRWARVAFAARCARRVLPMATHFWQHAPERHFSAIVNAVSVAERSAVTAHAASPHAAATLAAEAYSAPETYAHATVARAAAAAGAAAETAAHAASDTHSAHAAARAAGHAGHDVVRPVRCDFETVHGLALANGWTDDTPVPPSVFGPLWPDGPPDGWSKPEKPTTEIVIEFDIPDDTIPQNAMHLAGELFALVSLLDIVGGGHGVSFGRREISALVSAPAPVSPMESVPV